MITQAHVTSIINVAHQIQPQQYKYFRSTHALDNFPVSQNS